VQEENQSIIIATVQTIVSNQASFASYQWTTSVHRLWWVYPVEDHPIQICITILEFNSAAISLYLSLWTMEILWH
jgi:hypothetical protein